MERNSKAGRRLVGCSRCVDHDELTHFAQMKCRILLWSHLSFCIKFVTYRFAKVKRRKVDFVF